MRSMEINKIVKLPDLVYLVSHLETVQHWLSAVLEGGVLLGLRSRDVKR